MPPPRHRDRGFSRRIQLGLFVGYVSAAAGIVAAAALLLVARFDPLAFEGIRGLALDLTAPVSGVGRDVVRGAGSLGDEVADYLGAARQNAVLRADLADARRRLVEQRVLRFENARMRRALHLVERGTQPVAAARIVGSDLSGHRRYATLAAGGDEGVRAGQPVRAPEGLVGRVAEAGRHASRVTLLSDGASTVPVRVIRTGQPAIVAGRGEGTLDVRSSQVGALPFRRGDLLVTSGTGGVYPADLPVAVVIAAAGETATARPLADPARLDLALVLPEAAAAPPPPPVADGRRR